MGKNPWLWGNLGPAANRRTGRAGLGHKQRGHSSAADLLTQYSSLQKVKPIELANHCPQTDGRNAGSLKIAPGQCTQLINRQRLIWNNSGGVGGIFIA